MNIQDKIRTLREEKNWTQDDMADKMGMSKAGYGKIERGESRVSLEKLEKIAQIFDVDIIELIKDNKGSVYVFGEHNSGTGTNINYYGSTNELAFENEKLKLELAHKDDIIARQADELQQIQLVLDLLKDKFAS